MDIECRYCLEGGGLLISPCACSGTNKYVHRGCLDTWRVTNPQYDTLCRECNTPYTFVRDVFPEDQIIFPNIPLLLHYLFGIISITATTIIVVECDPGASSTTLINHLWKSNFTDIVSEDDELLVLYSASFAGACLYSTFVLVMVIYLMCTLNRPIHHFSQIQVLKSYSILLAMTQSPNIMYYIIGYFPYFSTTISYSIMCFIPLWTYWFIDNQNNRILPPTTSATPGDR